MSDFNPLVRKSIPTHRSGFDMSEKKMFTAKVGELLPVMWQYALPGDVFEISEEWFTRTRPVNTSAYTRIREYYDFYAVPLRLLNRNLPTAFAQMSDYAVSANSPTENASLIEDVPHISMGDMYTSINSYGSSAVDDAGYDVKATCQKLLYYLNYGVIDPSPAGSSLVSKYTTNYASFPARKINLDVSVLPMNAYQKIYFDFYSNTQWEKHLAYSYNTDYLNKQTRLTALPVEMCKMRYANYNKDYFMGVLPNSQYGDAALVSHEFGYEGLTEAQNKNLVFGAVSSSPVSIDSGWYSAGNDSQRFLGVNNNSTLSISVPANSKLVANIQYLAVRASEYLQRWKEVVQFASKDYNDQMKAQWGIRGNDAMGNHCHFIGGFSGNIDINEVVNTNLSDQGSQASIAGKGIGSGRSRKLRYTVGAEHCIIMCIYHAVPLVDYSIDAADPQLQRVGISDFPQPAFDSLGLESVPLSSLTSSVQPSAGGEDYDAFLGYSLRYPDYKTRVDRITGAFQTTLKNWVAPVSWANLKTPARGTIAFTYLSFKVRPNQLDPIFDVAANAQVDTDQLLCNSQFNVHVVRNLSRDGLPY